MSMYAREYKMVPIDSVELPPEETPMLVLYNGIPRILERCWCHPTFEDTFRSFWFWQDPHDLGAEIDHDKVTHILGKKRSPIAEMPLKLSQQEDRTDAYYWIGRFICSWWHVRLLRAEGDAGTIFARMRRMGFPSGLCTWVLDRAWFYKA